MLWEKGGDAKENSDLKKVDLPTLSITEPTIVIISGWPVADRKKTMISKEIHSLKKLLAPYAASRIYCLSHRSGLSASFNTLAYNFSPAHETKAARDFAQWIIAPLVSENGRPLPLDAAKQRLRNLTLYTICAGAVAGQEIYNAALKKMKDIGYKHQEAAELLQEVVDIAVAPLSSPWKETNRFSTLSLVNSDDGMLKLVHPLRALFHKHGQRLKISPLSATSVLVTASARRKIWQWRKKEVIEGVSLPRWRAISHDMPDYINMQDKSSQFSRIVQYALINAVNRKATIKPMDLLEAPATLEGPAQDNYQRRIRQAFST